MAIDLLPYALGFGIVGLLVFLGIKLWDKNRTNYCIAFLSEMVGEEEHLLGWVTVLKVENNKVTSLKVKGHEHSFIDLPSSKDYFYSKEKGKVLFIVKYGERDFRVKKKFDGEWYKKVNIPVYEEVENERGEIEKKYRLNEEGNVIYEVIEETYQNPLGIDQEGMDAIRTSLINEEQINKELEVDTFWNKWGNHIVFVGAIMICALLIMKVSGDTKESFKISVTECKDAANQMNEVAEDVNSPLWAEQVLNYVQNRNNEPPPANS